MSNRNKELLFLLRQCRKNPALFANNDQALKLHRIIKKTKARLYKDDRGVNRQSIILSTD